MTRIDRVMQIEERAANEAAEDGEDYELQTKEHIMEHECPGFSLDYTVSKCPPNKTVKKCGKSVGKNGWEKHCIPCWEEEYTPEETMEEGEE